MIKSISNPLPIIYIDKKSKEIGYVNESMAKLYGFKNPSAIIGKKIQDIIKIHWSAKIIESVLEGKECIHKNIVVKNQFKDAKYYTIFCSTIKNKSGEIIGALEVIIDMTGCKKNEKKVLKYQNEYHSLIEAIQDSVCIIDKNCRYKYINTGCVQRFEGLTQKEIIGMKYGGLGNDIDNKDIEKQIKKSIVYWC